MKRSNLLTWGLALFTLILAIFVAACAEISYVPGMESDKSASNGAAAAQAPGNYARGGAGGRGGAAVPSSIVGGFKAQSQVGQSAQNAGGLSLSGGILNLDGGLVKSGQITLGGANTYSGAAAANGGVLSKDEELLIIPKGGSANPATRPSQGLQNQATPRPETPAPSDSLPIPGSPILVARQADKIIPIPLKHTDVSANISGYIASVGVTQQFTNPYSEKIEAVYVFPLPENAGINEFVMTIGDRHIRGIIRERAEAEKIYQQAKAQGYTASLMTQERPNIFTQNVANIEPGKQIDIQIRYFHTLSYNDGWFEWVFPMVVGPRYNPAGSTQGVGAVARNNAGASGQQTEVQYLRPEERSGHDISLQVQLDAGMAIEELQCVNHHIHRLDGKNNSTLVQLDPADTLPNKDFVLRYRVAGDKVKTGLFVQKDKGGAGGWFTLMLVPPAELKSLPRRAVEMVFVVDTSGSMSGQPIAQAKAAVDVALSKMQPGDTFQIVKFDSTTGQMAPMPLAVNPQNIFLAHQYVATMQGGGGTEMLKGMNAALDFPHDENRTRVVSFMTDGYIGNEIEILKALRQRLLDSRVFSFGVGSSPNRYLLDAMARLGHGNAAYLSLNEPAQPVMDKYFERISHPALATIKVEFSGGMKVSEVYPQRIPELFVGRPVIITGRYTGSISGDILISGRAGDQPVHYTLSSAGSVEENPAIATVWARMKVADLHDEAIYEGRDVSADVKETALAYGIMSEFTSFVAVDSTHQTAGDHGTTVAVPVPVPQGVRYETTVQEGALRRDN